MDNLTHANEWARLFATKGDRWESYIPVDARKASEVVDGVQRDAVHLRGFLLYRDGDAWIVHTSRGDGT